MKTCDTDASYLSSPAWHLALHNWTHCSMLHGKTAYDEVASYFASPAWHMALRRRMHCTMLLRNTDDMWERSVLLIFLCMARGTTQLDALHEGISVHIAIRMLSDVWTWSRACVGEGNRKARSCEAILKEGEY